MSKGFPILQFLGRYVQVLGFILEITKAARIAELCILSSLSMKINKIHFKCHFLKKKKRKKARKKLERKKQTENDSPCVCVVCFTFSSPLEPLLSFTICRFWVYNRSRLFTVPYFFMRSFRGVYRVLPPRVSWFSNVLTGRGSGIIALGGRGRGKKNIFLASSQTAPAP